MKYRAMKSGQVRAELALYVGEEGAQKISICPLCEPTSLSQCHIACKHGSSGVADLFVQRHNPTIMHLRIKQEAENYLKRSDGAN